MFCLQGCMCTTGMSSASEDQKKATDLQELVLPVIVWRHVGAGDGATQLVAPFQ